MKTKKLILTLGFFSIFFSCKKSEDLSSEKKVTPDILTSIKETSNYKKFAYSIKDFKANDGTIKKSNVSGRVVYFINVPFERNSLVKNIPTRTSSDSIIEVRYQYDAVLDSLTGFVFGVLSKYEISELGLNSETLKYTLSEYVEPGIRISKRSFVDKTILVSVQFDNNVNYSGPAIEFIGNPNPGDLVTYEGWWERTNKCYKQLNDDCAGVIPCDLACIVLPCKAVHALVCAVKSFFEG